jgi:AcrR family transcriptional regulator
MSRRSVSSLREEQRDVARRRLREAALAVFAQRGYAAATADEIAAAAGASRATFYRHFGSKAELIRDLVATLTERERIWDGLRRLDNPSRSEVEAWLREVIELYDTHRSYFLAVEQAVAVEPDLTEEYYRQSDAYVDVTAQVLHLDDDGARLQALLLWVQLTRLMFLWRVRGIELDERRTMDMLTDIWHGALNHHAA